MDSKDLRHRFDYHPPSNENVKNAHEEVRGYCLDLAVQFDTLLLDCREKALAITKLEETMFWANAAIARRMNVEPEA